LQGPKPGSRCAAHRSVRFVRREIASLLTACGFGLRGNAMATLREGNASKGPIPGALSGRNKPGEAARGGNRQEGNQTLKADHSGPWHGPCEVDPRRQHVLKGRKAHERSRLIVVQQALGPCANSPARIGRERLWRTVEVDERCGVEALTRIRPAFAHGKPQGRGNGRRRRGIAKPMARYAANGSL
jgi:hypothetical protein